MCRLIAAISKDPVNAAYFLKDAPRSLVFQSSVDKKRLQGDGWGIGWFEKNRPQIFKSPKALYRDSANVLKALRKTKGNISLGVRLNKVNWFKGQIREIRFHSEVLDGLNEPK